jgi:hypothetical protein
MLSERCLVEASVGGDVVESEFDPEFETAIIVKVAARYCTICGQPQTTTVRHGPINSATALNNTEQPDFNPLRFCATPVRNQSESDYP